MKVDSLRVLKNVSTVAVTETKSTLKLVQLYGENGYRRLSKVAKEKSHVVAGTISDWIVWIANDPRVTNMRNRVQAWYESNMERQVHTYITPFYRLQVEPLLASMSKILSRGKSQAIVQIHFLWTLFIESCKKLINILLEKINAWDAEGTKLPGYILYCFQYAEEYTEELIIWVLKVQACIALVYFRVQLLRTALFILLLPFQIIWWLCPLRLLLKSCKSLKKRSLNTTTNIGATITTK